MLICDKKYHSYKNVHFKLQSIPIGDWRCTMTIPIASQTNSISFRDHRGAAGTNFTTKVIFSKPLSNMHRNSLKVIGVLQFKFLD